jgi:hypothetical protein
MAMRRTSCLSLGARGTGGDERRRLSPITSVQPPGQPARTSRARRWSAECLHPAAAVEDALSSLGAIAGVSSGSENNLHENRDDSYREASKESRDRRTKSDFVCDFHQRARSNTGSEYDRSLFFGGQGVCPAIPLINHFKGADAPSEHVVNRRRPMATQCP